MAAQRAGQKRKVVEISRPTRKEERSEFEDLELNGGLDDGDSQNTDSNDEEEEYDDDEDEEDLDDSEDDVPEWDSDDSASNGSLAELDPRKHVQDLETQLEADRSARRKLMGSDTARDVSSIHPDTPLAPLPLVFDEADAAPPNYKLSTDANGNPRYIYKEIEPAYDSDDSDAAVTANTIGNIPLSYYDAYPHIGYDINGRRISRPAKGEALDSLLESIDLPEGWTGLTDPSTGQPLKLTREELDVLKKLTRHEAPGDGYDPYPDMVEWFTGKGKEEVMPLSAAPEPKRRFVPSAHEHKRVMKMVKAIKDGRIKPYREPTQEEKDREEAEQEYASYDVWANEEPRPDHPMNVPAPKLPPPGYEESYHPPPEYLPNKHEREEWEKLDDEDRVRDFLPKDYSTLRKVPGYANLVKEKFERCLDLYLAPRVRRSKLNIDPESLLPKLPDPQELKPFPTTTATIYRGHEGRVRTLAMDPSGTWVVSGGEDGTVRLWDILSGRQLWRVRLSSSEAVNVVSWRPDQNTSIIAACCGETVFFMIPQSNLLVPDVEEESQQILDAGFGYAAAAPTKNAAGVDQVSSASWSRTPTALQAKGVFLSLTLRSTPKTLTWHRRGDYFSTVSPSNSSAASTAVAIHTLSKHQTQFPFKRLRGLAQTACFHSSRPLFFVATRQSVRIYDLQAQKLEKELRPGARWISGISLHPLGSNLLVSSYDKRLLWHDLDLGNTPYKTLRYHSKAIRNVHFHPSLPLFADASDDGTLQIFHGKVVGDSMENATIVPLKVLKGHKIQKELGVFDVQWHPREAWCISAGADGTMRLWT